MRRLALVLLIAMMPPAAIQAQRLPKFKPTAQGFLFLPVALNNPIFDNLTAVLGQVDGCFQVPLYKGMGAGVGMNATFYELNENGLSQEETIGYVNRLLYYGKLSWSAYTGPRTFYEVNAKLGQSSWDWNCSTCIANKKQSDLHWGVNAAYFVHATDNLAFGLSVGYEADAASFGPEVIGLDHFPGRTDNGAPYHFLTIGLGFSTGFAKGSREPAW
jgi:hypothetical protein